MATYQEKQARLQQLTLRAEKSYELAKILASQQGRTTPVRHKCFISYHGADIDGVLQFVEDYNQVFIPRVIGVSDSDHFNDPINSDDEDYIKERIGAKYLTDSTVTVLYVGRCAWSRKYVDWEISSSLRDGKVNKRNGLMAITPPDHSANRLPARFDDNYSDSDDSYADYYYYPRSDEDLRGWIQTAFKARQTRSHLIKNGRELRKRNSDC